MPTTLYGSISGDSITHSDEHSELRLGIVYDLTQIKVALNENADMSEIKCTHCGADLNEADPTITAEDEDPECGASDDGLHEKEWAPLTWAKNIDVSFDEEHDQIQLTIATGEPRGGWTFTLRRDQVTGVVYMHLPHADMSSPHEPIKEIHPGTFAIS